MKVNLNVTNFNKLESLLKEEYKTQAVFNPKKDMLLKPYGFSYLDIESKSYPIIKGMVSIGIKSSEFEFGLQNNKEIFFEVLNPNRHVARRDFGLINTQSQDIILQTIKRLETQKKQKERIAQAILDGEESKKSGGGGGNKKGFYLLNKNKSNSSENDIKNLTQATKLKIISEEFTSNCINRALSMHKYQG